MFSQWWLTSTPILLWSIEQDVVGEERGDDKAYITKSVSLRVCVCARNDILSH